MSLGGLGVVLFVVGLILWLTVLPGLGWILAVVGAVLILVAVMLALAGGRTV